MASSDLLAPAEGGLEDLPEIDGQPLEEEPALAASAGQPANAMLGEPEPTTPAAEPTSANGFDLRASLGNDLGFDLGGPEDSSLISPPSSQMPAGAVSPPSVEPLFGAQHAALGQLPLASPLVPSAGLAPLPSFTPPAPSAPLVQSAIPASGSDEAHAHQELAVAAEDLHKLANEPPRPTQGLGDLLGEMDFDLPPPPPAGGLASSGPSASKPTAAPSPVLPSLGAALTIPTLGPTLGAETSKAPAGKPGAPSFGAFKAAANPFAAAAKPAVTSPGAPVPPTTSAGVATSAPSSSVATTPLAAPPVAPSLATPTLAAPPLAEAASSAGLATQPSAGLDAHLREALSAALRSDAAPTTLPEGATRVAFNLARVLLKKGVVTLEDLL